MLRPRRASDVRSLFGATPEQVRQREMESQADFLAQMQSDPYQSAGAAIGVGLSRLFGGKSKQLQEAEQRQEAVKGIDELGTMAEAEAAQRGMAPLSMTEPDVLAREANRLESVSTAFRNLGQDTGDLDNEVLRLRVEADKAKRAMSADELKRRATELEIQVAEEELRGLGKPKPIAPNVYSDLVAKHGFENTEEYLKTRDLTDLGPVLPEKEQQKLSEYGRLLVESGVPYGSEKFKDYMGQYAGKKLESIGKSITVVEKSPMEQKEFISGVIESNPLYKASAEMMPKISKAKAVLNRAKKGEGEAITILQRQLSDINNSDTRAASEITRLITDNKSLGRQFNDFISGKAFGELSAGTIQNMQGLLEAAERVVKEDTAKVVTNKLALYGNDIDQNVAEDIRTSLGAGGVSATSNDPYGLR